MILFKRVCEYFTMLGITIYQPSCHMLQSWSKMMEFDIIKMTPICINLPTFVVSMIKYFTTDLGEEAFDMAVHQWWVFVLVKYKLRANIRFCFNLEQKWFSQSGIFIHQCDFSLDANNHFFPLFFTIKGHIHSIGKTQSDAVLQLHIVTWLEWWGSSCPWLYSITKSESTYFYSQWSMRQNVIWSPSIEIQKP